MRRNDSDASSWMHLACWLANRGDRSGALAGLRRAVELAPHDVTGMALAGAVHNLLGDRQEALHWFGEAVRHGYGIERLKRDPELGSLRLDPDFVRILEEGSCRNGARMDEAQDLGGAA